MGLQTHNCVANISCTAPHIVPQVEALQQWARNADSDLYIAEALLGAPLGPAQVTDVVDVFMILWFLSLCVWGGAFDMAKPK